MYRLSTLVSVATGRCDRHPRDKLAMIHEDFAGRIREVSWGELQDDSNRFANVLRAHGVEPGDRVAMLLPPTPETAAAFFGVWKAGAILLSMSVLYGDEGIRHRVTDSRPKVLLTKGYVVKAFVVLASGYDASPELAAEIKVFVNERHSAYAYPRLIEFVPDLPKTLTGKIRRIELRQSEQERAKG
jgi:acyl-coenzyme A synthetase/AMP-(fatty) acid ligase